MTVLFDCSPPTFLSIHQNQDKRHPASRVLDGLYRLQRRAASGYDIIDHHDQVTFLEIAFDQFLPPVRLNALAHDERLEGAGWSIRTRGERDTERDRIGTHCQAAYGINFAAGFGILFDQIPADLSDEPGPSWIQGRKPGIDVKIALRSGSEGEISPANGIFNQYLEQFLL